MRYVFLVGCFVAMGLQAPAGQEFSSNVWIAIEPIEVPQGASAATRVQRAMYVGDMGSVAVGLSAKPLPGLMFTLRAWQEGTGARVVVSARLQDPRAPGGKTESPIATFLMTPGQSVEVRESEAWGAPRLRVTAETR